MALGKTITYTPFGEESFAYGATELATNYSTEFPNTDDIVKIVIEHTNGNWNDTGHISTPSSGTAVSMYNKITDQWICKGERDDVDVVLSLLSWYPADSPESRPYASDNLTGFIVKRNKQNVTSGNFSGDTLTGSHLIGDTSFSVKVYDGSDVEQVSETITFDPTEPSYDNQRPYWSTEPTTTNYSGAAYDDSIGGTLGLGTVSHGSDTDLVQLDVYFKPYTDADPVIKTDVVGDLNISTYTRTNEFGYILHSDNLFVGERRPIELTSDDTKKFSFVGSVAECQLMMDNLRYKTKDSSQKKTFDLVMTLGDGPTASVVRKTMWHTQTLQVSPLPDQHFKEDTTTRFDLGSVVWSNIDSLLEVNQYKAVITLDSTGQGGATSFGTTTTVDTETYSSGVLTIVDSNLTTFKEAIRNLEFVPTQDFADDFTFTVVFTFENTTVGSSYSSTSQTVDVTAEETAEVENITVTHNWNEDQVYFFKGNTPLQIIHPYNENFSVEFDFSLEDDIGGIDEIGEFNTSNVSVSRTISDQVIQFTGTRDQLNDALENMYYAPVADFDKSFTVAVKTTRTSGSNLANADISTGTFTMTATAQEEYTFTQQAKIAWEEDADFVDFETGLELLDTSLEDPLLPAFGSFYKLTLRAKYADGTAVGDELTWTSQIPLDATVSGSGTVSDPMIISGQRNQVNSAMASLRFVPDADFTAAQDFRFEFKLERGAPGDDWYALYVNFDKKVSFESGTASDEFEAQAETKFGIERITPITDYKIVDAAKNKIYTLVFTMSSQAEGYLRATQFGNSTVAYDGVNKKLTLLGNKEDLNAVLLTVEYIPGFNYNTDFTISYFQYQNTDSIQQTVGNPSWSMVFDATLGKYQTDTSESLFYAEDLLNQENILAYTTLENLDGAEFITDDPVHYVTQLRLNPTTQIYFTGDYVEDDYVADDYLEARGSELTFTGSRDTCNKIIKDMTLNAFADQVGDVDIHYTQIRYIDNTLSEIQADDVVGIDRIRCSGNTGEVIFSPWNQYFAAGDNAPTQRYMQEYEKENGEIKNRYTPPMNIIDKASSPEGETLYKLEVISSNIPVSIRDKLYIEEIPYATKANFHAAIEDGLKMIAEDILDPNDTSEYVQAMYHQREFEVNIRITRKLADDTVSILEDNKLTYVFISRPFLVKPSKISSSTSILKAESFVSGTGAYQNPVINITSQDITAENGDFNDINTNKSNLGFWGWAYPSPTSGRYIDADFNDNWPYDGSVFKNVSGHNAELGKTSRSVTRSTTDTNNSTELRLYYIVPFDGITAIATANHSYTNRFGITSTADIAYEQKIVKYSEYMRLRPWSYSDPHFGMFGNDSGGQNASFTIKLEDKKLSDLNVNYSLQSNAVLCSHFWVSQDKYAFKFFDAYDNVSPNWFANDKPDVVHDVNENENFPNDERYVVEPGDTFAMRVSKKSKNTRIKDDKTFDVAARFVPANFDGRNEKFNMNFVTEDRNIVWGVETPGDVVQDVTHSASAWAGKNNEKSAVTHSIMTYDDNKTGTHAWYVASHELKSRSKAKTLSIAHRRLGFGGDQTVEDKYYVYISNSGGTIDYCLHKVGDTLYLVTVGSYEESYRKLVAGTSDQYVDEIVVKNTGSLLSLDLTDANARFETVNTFSAETDIGIGSYNSYRTTKEKAKWGRKSARDNTCRILAKSTPVGVAFILPTGEWVNEEGNLYNFRENPLFNLNTDLRDKEIDKFIDIAPGKLAYVSVKDGVISDDNLINIVFDNYVSSTRNFNYIYITQDAFDRTKIYAMMRYLEKGDTTSDYAGYDTLSRLMFINLEE